MTSRKSVEQSGESSCQRLSATIQSALEKGRKALEASQQSNGCFEFHQLKKDDGFPRDQSLVTDPLFATLTVLLAAGDQLSKSALDRALRFIVDRRGSDGHWNYDPAMGIPADSDDTACALAVFARFSPAQITANDVMLLRSYWRSPEGPFRTWQSTELPWNQTNRDDVVVNCNIAYALRLLECPLTEVENARISTMLAATVGRTRYYCSCLTVGYAARRAMFTPSLFNRCLVSADPLSLNALEMAQLIVLSPRKDFRHLEYLIRLQEPDGSWPPAPWCDGEGLDPWGSSPITTALCLEAIHGAQQYHFSR